MGKSSLLIRIIEDAVRAGKRVAFIDFQLFEKSALPILYGKKWISLLSHRLHSIRMATTWLREARTEHPKD
jgi:hypothetical protein